MSDNLKFSKESRHPHVVDNSENIFTINEGIINYGYRWALGIWENGDKVALRLEYSHGRIYLKCWDNSLVELFITEFLDVFCCVLNSIKSLTLPPSVKELVADKTVKGLEKYIDKVDIELI